MAYERPYETMRLARALFPNDKGDQCLSRPDLQGYAEVAQMAHEAWREWPGRRRRRTRASEVFEFAGWGLHQS
jgi:hypothetical protein